MESSFFALIWPEIFPHSHSTLQTMMGERERRTARAKSARETAVKAPRASLVVVDMETLDILGKKVTLC